MPAQGLGRQPRGTEVGKGSRSCQHRGERSGKGSLLCLPGSEPEDAAGCVWPAEPEVVL